MCNIRFGSQGMILNGFKQKKVEIILRAPHHRLDFMIGNLMEDPLSIIIIAVLMIMIITTI